jgi:hypothetical protein
LANFPVAYCGLKIITSLSLRFPDFQRMKKRFTHAELQAIKQLKQRGIKNEVLLSE